MIQPCCLTPGDHSHIQVISPGTRTRRLIPGSFCGAGFLTVTPGVRFADGDVGDQKRVTTPARAKELGSDYIVVGRPITQAEDPVAAYRRCVAEFVG